MKIRPRPHVIPCLAAAVAVTVASAATVWSAKPLYGPMVAEFGWHPRPLVIAASASIAITALLTSHADRLAGRLGVRSVTLGGCLASGLLLLLVLPNLTHLWQLMAMLLALGVGRALILGGAWHQLRQALSTARASLGILVCTVIDAGVVTSWVAQIVYRNSWREGAAACGGLLLVIAAPISYLLLPGREVERCESDGD